MTTYTHMKALTHTHTVIHFLAISPPFSTLSLGIDDVITLNCTTPSNPLPRLEWFIDNQPITDSYQAATGFMETAFSILTLNISELAVGENSIICIPTHDISPSPGPLTAIAIVTVEVILRNATVEPRRQTVVQTGNEENNVTLVCQVEASPQLPLIIEWARNGALNNVIGTPAERVGETLVYTSSLTLLIGDLIPGGELFRCVITQGERSSNARAVVNVHSE